VHEVKGQGIDAVLYLAKKADVTHLLAGPSSEEGRIGYVALTRARDLLILAVPNTIGAKSMDHLRSVGFKDWE
jgi:ATP-dependent exoDNAse (exonuclease V) beta subunit